MGKAGSCFDGYHFSICEVGANRSGCLRMRTLLRARIARSGIGRRDLKYLRGKNLWVGIYLYQMYISTTICYFCLRFMLSTECNLIIKIFEDTRI